MNRRDFIAGLTATAAGLLIPERRIWALDQTMIVPQVDGFGGPWSDVVAFGSMDNLGTSYANIIWYRYRDGRYVEYQALPGGGWGKYERMPGMTCSREGWGGNG